jgi:PadR family transcriptional regulator, regulatory protein PadR
MVRTPKMSSSVVSVLEVFLEDPQAVRYGLELGASTGLASGTIHPVLARLEGAGWVESEWEEIDPVSVGRPRRRFYRLTAAGVEQASAALDVVAARRERLARRLGAARRHSPLTGGV